MWMYLKTWYWRSRWLVNRINRPLLRHWDRRCRWASSDGIWRWGGLWGETDQYLPKGSEKWDIRDELPMEREVVEITWWADGEDLREEGGLWDRQPYRKGSPRDLWEEKELTKQEVLVRRSHWISQWEFGMSRRGPSCWCWGGKSWKNRWAHGMEKNRPTSDGGEGRTQVMLNKLVD